MALSVLVALGASEVALRLLVPAERHYAVLRPNTHEVLRPDPRYLPGVNGEAHFDVNSVGIRGPEFTAADSSAFRILAIGGSTTELLYLDEPETWPHLLAESLRGGVDSTAARRGVWVGSVGRSGMNARDHVVQVKHLTVEYGRLDMILVLAGVNDLTTALSQGDHYARPPPLTDPAAELEQIRRAFEVAPGSLAHPSTDPAFEDAPWWKRTANYQLLKRAKFVFSNVMLKRGLVQDSEGRRYAEWRRNRAQASRIIVELPDLGQALEEYRSNLNAIVDLAGSRSVHLVMVNQPALWRSDLGAAEQQLLWLGGLGDFMQRAGQPYYAVGSLALAMQRFNDTMLDVCRVRQVDCIDLAARVPKDASMFYDDVHLTEEGARRVATEIAAVLRPWVPR